ncbi:MAG: TonB-dependent receptor [Candidatus Aminicenantes bacterium]|nr:MAG: TonB-dependent receptor [Candidatus Aminicenantes bacterium]
MSGKKSFFLILLLVFVALTGDFVLAQKTKEKKRRKEKESTFHPHEEIVVTATMTPRSVKDCSASVSVVSEVDIKATAASNVLNLLNNQPGVFIRKTGDFGRADVDIRGIGQRGRRIAILVDGRPEKMGLFGCAVTHAFPLDNVERIEVVRGPSSVLYGSEALGGVVNIITRMPREKFESDFSASYGSFNTQQFNLRFGGNLNRFRYYFTLDRRSSDGHRENSSYSGNAFTGKMAYDLSERFQVSFQGKYFDGKKHEAGPIDFALEDFWNSYKRGVLDFSLTGKGEKDEIFLKIYGNFGHHRFSDGWHSRDFINGGVIRYTTRKISNNELTVGADFRILGGKSYYWPKGNWDKSEAAIFFQDEHVFWKKFILSVGMRFHRDSLFGIEICPHGGLVYQLSEKTSLRGTINKGFRSPQLNELYMYPAANSELKPERVWNYEMGFKQKIAHWLTLDGAFYLIKGFDLIETQPYVSPPPAFKFVNIGKFDFKGAELSLKAALNKSLSGILFYTYLDPGDKTKGRPGQKLDFSLRLRKKSFYVSLHAQYVTDYFASDFSEEALPSYFLLNSRLIVDISRNIELFLDLNNIFNKEYSIFVDLPGIATGIYPMPGLNLNIGFRLKH